MTRIPRYYGPLVRVVPSLEIDGTSWDFTVQVFLDECWQEVAAFPCYNPRAEELAHAAAIAERRKILEGEMI